MAATKYKIIDVDRGIVIANNLTIVEVKDFKKKNPVKSHLRVVPVGYDTKTVIKERGPRR